MVRIPHVSKGFKKLSIPKKIVFGEAVIKDMTDNVAVFATPKIPIATLKAKNDALRTTAGVAERGSEQNTLDMYDAETAWILAFDEQADYVDALAKGNLNIIAKSGYESTATETEPAKEPDVVVIQKLQSNGVAGGIVAELAVMEHTKGFVMVISTTAATPVLTNGQFMIANNPTVICTVTETHRKLSISNLPRRSDLFVSIAAFNSVGFGKFSAPVMVGVL